MELNGRRKNKMKIHPLTVCREKLQNNDFITTNYRKKAEMLEDIIAEEEELRNFAAEIYFEISNKILVRNSKRRKVLDCLKKLNLEYNYTSYVTDFDEINTMLEQFENRCQQLLGKKNDFSDAIENDYLNSRNILRNSIMDDTDIYNSISTVNPRIYEKMKWYLEGELRNNTETRKLELVLARIVSHAFTKTSPMGWLNKVGIIGTMNPIRYELKKNNISLNFVLLFQMYDRIILRDEYIEDVKFKLNKNFYIVDSEINIFGQRDNAQNHKLFKSRDCNVKVKNNPYFAPILNQADKNDWYFKDILELLELDKEQTGVFIRKLVEIGLFRIDSYFSDEGDVLQHFVDKLGEITKEKDDLASCVRGDFVEIQKLVKEINQEYSLDLEKRIIEIEKSACEKCGLDAGFKSREFIYKDNIVVKDKVHNLPESAQYSISKLMQLYTIFDVNTRIQQEVKMELERKMKTDSIPINNPYIFQLVANVNMKYSNFWIDPWKQITSESEIIKKLDELRTSFINELLKSAEKNEVVISEEFIDSLINQIPSELKKKKAAYSIFYEMDCDDVVINKIYPGYMSFYNRFLRYTDIIEKYRDEIKDFYKVEGENIAEIYETFGFNANSYYPIFDDRLEFDLTRNHAIDENYKEVINIYDTNLVYHDNEFLLQKDGTDYKPVICTSLMRVLYPGIITFYSSLFSNISHVSDASAIFFNQLSVDRVNVSPRIKMLNIILERQHWIINTDLIKLNQNDNVSQFTQIGHESEQLTKLLENRIQMYFGDFSSNKVTRKTQIIVVDQRNDLDKIEEAIANIEADNYIVMAFNANKESWIYSTKIKSEVIQMLDQFMCCSEKKVRFSDAFCAVAANYMVLMLMDSLSGYRKMFNTYCINSSLEIKNKSFYGLKLGADAFRKVKEDYVRIDESVTEAEALNRFIVKSKDIIDMNFEYEFKNDGNINRVITRVKDKEVIEAEGKNELLLDAAKESVTETIIKLFQSYGVKVSLALGFDEIKRLFASEKSVYAFDDKGIFSKEGVLIFRVD